MSTRFDAISGLSTVEVVVDALPITYRLPRYAVLRRLLCRKSRMSVCLPFGAHVAAGTVCESQKEWLVKTTIRDAFQIAVPALLLMALTACGGGVGSPPPPPPPSTYMVGGIVQGLTGSGLVLQNNAADDLAVSASGTFTCTAAFALGAAYAVTVKTQPSSPAQNCVVSGSPGTITVDDVGAVVVTCTNVGRFAYAANAGDNTISVYSIDLTTGALTPIGTPVPTGTSPYAIEARGDGQYVYVVNQISNNISVYAVNATSGALTPIAGSPFVAGSDPHALAFASTPSGSYLYVANNGSNSLSAYSVDAGTGALAPLSTATYATGTGPSAVSVSSDGGFVFVANNGGSNDISVFAITAETGALTPVVGSPFAAGGNPHSLALTPFPGYWDYGGAYLYAANFDGSNSTISGFSVDTGSGTLTALSGSPVAVPVSNYIGTDLNGLYLYVTTGASVVGYNLTTEFGLPVALAGFPVTSGTNAYSVTVDPSNQFFYVGNDGSASISGYKLDSATGGLTAMPGSPFAAGSHPDFIAIPYPAN
jgi:6-phosphogluconolactonase